MFSSDPKLRTLQSADHSPDVCVVNFSCFRDTAKFEMFELWIELRTAESANQHTRMGDGPQYILDIYDEKCYRKYPAVSCVQVAEPLVRDILMSQLLHAIKMRPITLSLKIGREVT